MAPCGPPWIRHWERWGSAQVGVSSGGRSAQEVGVEPPVLPAFRTLIVSLWCLQHVEFGGSRLAKLPPAWGSHSKDNEKAASVVLHGDRLRMRLLLLHGKFPVAICNVHQKYTIINNISVSVDHRLQHSATARAGLLTLSPLSHMVSDPEWQSGFKLSVVKVCFALHNRKGGS